MVYVNIFMNRKLLERRKMKFNFVPGIDRSTNLKKGYLKMCYIVGFGIGSMIKSGLHFGELFDHDILACNGVLHALRPILHVSFTFVQLYFVFLNSKVSCTYMNSCDVFFLHFVFFSEIPTCN